MKEATGELSMTVVVIIAVIAVIGIVSYLFVGENAVAKKWLDGQWTNMTSKTNQNDLNQP